VLRSDPGRDGGASRRGSRFVLYVEGPRDREILGRWAQRLSPVLATKVEECAVILGGRRPERAVAHFRDLRRQGEGRRRLRALCVLDRDRGLVGPEPEPAEPGLEFYTWPRRHIESYLLVPAAIRRGLRLAAGDARIERLLRDVLPSEADEGAWVDLDAKRLLASRGPLARGLGRPLVPGRIAWAMRASELHDDVLALFERLREALELPESGPGLRS
jgi:hypothetical protein